MNDDDTGMTPDGKFRVIWHKSRIQRGLIRKRLKNKRTVKVDFSKALPRKAGRPFGPSHPGCVSKGETMAFAIAHGRAVREILSRKRTINKKTNKPPTNKRAAEIAAKNLQTREPFKSIKNLQGTIATELRLNRR